MNTEGLSKQEIREGLEKLLNDTVALKQICETIFVRYSEGNDITEEILTKIMDDFARDFKIPKMDSDQISTIFKKFDRNANGLIDQEELTEIVNQCFQRIADLMNDCQF